MAKRGPAIVVGAPIPDRPHMPEAVAAWLEARLRSAKCFLEYGSGGSTRLAASLNVPLIVSVESDAAFASSVAAAVEGSGSTSVLEMMPIDIGVTKEWGFPANYNEFRSWPEYALAPWDLLREKGLTPDFILIDGRFRVSSCLASLLEARPGTPILFDDYLLRPNFYRHVEQILPPSEVIEGSAIFIVPDVLPLRKIARVLARHIVDPE